MGVRQQLGVAARRMVGLRGDAVANAGASVRVNRRAREHRETVAADVETLNRRARVAADAAD